MCLIFAITYSHAEPELTNDQIAEILIQESIRNYFGNCPCPYNLMKNGRRCGNYSAYSKPGGKSPLCYREDVTEELIREWRNVHDKN